MNDIMDATGLQKGGLYRHFSGKEELAAEAFQYALGQAVKIRTDAIDPSLGAVKRLREVIAQFVEKPSPVPGGCPILNTAIDADDGNEVLRDLAREGLKEWRARIAEIVREGIERREISKDVDPRVVGNTIIAALEGALMISRLEGSRGALNDARRSLEVFIDGLAHRRI